MESTTTQTEIERERQGEVLKIGDKISPILSNAFLALHYITSIYRETDLQNTK